MCGWSRRRRTRRRLWKILKPKLNGGNTITAINIQAVPVIIYPAGIIKWTQNELEQLDQKHGKLMNIHNALHPKSDVDRLYLPQKTGCRGLLQIQQVVNESKRSLNGNNNLKMNLLEK